MLKSLMASNQIGNDADYWLAKGSFGVEDRVALVFGHVNDFAACSELAEILNKRYPAAQYTCSPAN